MSHILDRLNFLQSKELDRFSNDWGQTTRESRDWEETYRERWRHDKVVRSTHGVNCTGSCSWKIYVKSGIVTWEVQHTDYPRTRPDLPNHEPRGCARGASYSWYLYSANRVKTPLVRGKLMKAWRRMRESLSPVAAWTKLQEDPVLRERLTWVNLVATPGETDHPPVPFTAEALPEAIGALVAMSDINRFSHVVMDGSPVTVPMGMQRVKEFALRLFGGELEQTQLAPVPAGQALSLLPEAPLPEDLQWAAPNPRVAAALARWATTVENEASGAVPEPARDLVERNLQAWEGELMPLSRSWVDEETAALSGPDRAIARLVLVLAKAPYQADESLVEDVLRYCSSEEEQLIRILAWATSTAARRFGQRMAEKARRSLDESQPVA